MDNSGQSIAETNPLNEAQKRYLSASLVTMEKISGRVLFLISNNTHNEFFPDG